MANLFLPFLWLKYLLLFSFAVRLRNDKNLGMKDGVGWPVWFAKRYMYLLYGNGIGGGVVWD